jgi:hypothetical protein
MFTFCKDGRPPMMRANGLHTGITLTETRDVAEKYKRDYADIADNTVVEIATIADLVDRIGVSKQYGADACFVIDFKDGKWQHYLVRLGGDTQEALATDASGVLACLRAVRDGLLPVDEGRLVEVVPVRPESGS